MVAPEFTVVAQLDAVFSESEIKRTAKELQQKLLATLKPIELKITAQQSANVNRSLQAMTKNLNSVVRAAQSVEKGFDAVGAAGVRAFRSASVAKDLFRSNLQKLNAELRSTAIQARVTGSAVSGAFAGGTGASSAVLSGAAGSNISAVIGQQAAAAKQVAITGFATVGALAGASLVTNFRTNVAPIEQVVKAEGKRIRTRTRDLGREIAKDLEPGLKLVAAEIADGTSKAWEAAGKKAREVAASAGRDDPPWSKTPTIQLSSMEKGGLWERAKKILGQDNALQADMFGGMTSGIKVFGKVGAEALKSIDFKGLGRSAKQFAVDLSHDLKLDVTQALHGLHAGFSGIRVDLDGANTSLKKFGKTLAGVVAGGAAGFVGVVAVGFKAANDIDRQTRQLTALETQLGASAAESTRKIQEEANKLPGTFSDVEAGVVQLSSVLGLNLNQSIKVFETLTGAALASGGGIENVNRAITQMGQISAKGRVQLEELTTVAENIPGIKIADVIAEVGKSMGVTTDAARDLLSKGLIPSEVGLNAILTVAGKVPGAQNAIALSASSLEAKLSTLKDTLMRGLGQAILDAIDKAGGLDKILATVKDSMDKLLPSFTDLVAKTIEAAPKILELADALIQVADSAKTAIEAVGKLTGMLGTLGADASGTKKKKNWLDKILGFGGNKAFKDVLEFMGVPKSWLKGDDKAVGKVFEPIIKAKQNAEDQLFKTNPLKAGASTDDLLKSLDAILGASQDVAKAKLQLGTADSNLNKLLEEQKRLLADTGSELREIAAASDAVLKAQNTLRDLEEERVSILKDLADLQKPATADELAGAQDAITKATIALNQAKRDQLALDKELTPQQTQGLDLSGMSLDQIKSRLALVRLNLRTQHEATTTQGKTQAEIDESRMLAQISVNEAQRTLNSAIEDQTKLQNKVLDNAVAIREDNERLADLQIDLRDGERQLAEAQEASRKLAAGDTTRARALKDIDEQIKTAKEAQKTAAEAVRDAVAKQEELSAKNLSNEQQINKLLFDRIAIIDQLGGAAVAQAKSVLVASLPALLSSATLVDPKTGRPVAGPPLITQDQIKSIGDQLLNAPGSDLRAILKQILRATGLSVPGLARGAIVNSETYARIGEAGREAVLPLTRPARLQELLSDHRVLNPVLASLQKITLPGDPRLPGLDVARLDVPNVRGPANQSALKHLERQKANRELAKEIATELVAAGLGGGKDVGDININVPPSTNHEQLIARAVAREVKKQFDL